MMPRTLLVLPKSEREEIRVSVTEYKGETRIDIRTWYESRGGECKPGRAGLSIAPEQLPAIIKALAVATAKTQAS